MTRGGGYSNISVVYMGDQGNAKKGCFLRLIVICENPDWGQNVHVFKKKGPFCILFGGI